MMADRPAAPDRQTDHQVDRSTTVLPAGLRTTWHKIKKILVELRSRVFGDELLRGLDDLSGLSPNGTPAVLK